MSDEGTARPFSPAELDAIEDALEQLQGEGAFAVGELPDGGDALVRERLTSYRAISRLSRDVLQQYAAPSHVLDRVVALARETAVDAHRVAPLEAPARRSWWTRLRGAWVIPMVATAAGIALVAIIVVPMRRESDDRTADTVAKNSGPEAREDKSPAPTSAAGSPADAPQPTPTPSSADRLALADEPANAEPTVLRGAAALEQQTNLDDREQAERRRSPAPKDEAARDDAPSPTKPKAPSAGPNKSKSKPEPAPAQVPAEPAKPGGGAAPSTTVPAKNDAKTKGGKDVDTAKVETETLARADLARRGGDCAAAVPLYESVRKTGTRKQRARALVGLALCAETSGESDRATALLAQARAEDSGIDAYVESER